MRTFSDITLKETSMIARFDQRRSPKELTKVFHKKVCGNHTSLGLYRQKKIKIIEDLIEKFKKKDWKEID